MSRTWNLSAACLLACLSAPTLAQQAPLVPKQLSGPPEDFAAMRRLDPAASPILSRSALLPIELTADPADASAPARAHVDLPAEGGRLRWVMFTGDASWQPTLRGPDGQVMTPRAGTAASAGALSAASTVLGQGPQAQRGTEFRLDQAAPGTWSLQLRGAAPGHGYVLAEGAAGTQLASYRQAGGQWAGQRIGLDAVLTGSDAAGRTRMALQAGRIGSAQLRVIAPDGAITSWPMFDDGRHADGAAGDGRYGGDFPAMAPGTYVAQVVVRGTSADGQAFVRTAEHVVPVVARSLRLAGDTALAADAAGGRLLLDLPVATTAAATDHYRVYAQVWGTARDGSEVPVAWVGGMVAPRDGRLPVGFDPRWAARAGARAPFTLRQVRIEDPDQFVVLDQAADLPVTVSASRALATALRTPATAVTIDEAMRMGLRPQRSRLQAQAASGGRLLLVHGYCSEGVWPQSQFSNASTFLDANQNRSHDQFAQLLGQFGSQWTSFGTVAHSQGGAAALHLYTYYWSGLDQASGARLMQSVGTPYQGTNLSGILATVGSWFGIACGANSDMTYDGAANWLAGIPDWARAKVNYYTTSFKTTHWWVNDYCNIASDLVLSDPEDGTTEQAYGQLPGAINRGHTTGQCHTSGMRDPAQYLDASRNALMDANAAR